MILFSVFLARATCLPALALPPTAATIAAISTTSQSTVCSGTRFIDGQCSAFKVCAIQGSDRPIPFRVVTHLNESKTFGLSGIPVGDNADTINIAMYCEH
jgi:hypothetical protein